ncbi:DUF2306 domain-containing protein [Aquimarina sp. D1M17]|uniref:DUF2306 domain-containing protein n=1 Tax=Aquimarina acroporae TaxID=2937283 RepID=UPI0020C031E9|nr:DUF2306 domain-containing protein [Aquimarina acroporae]MCK8522884.1 DUF2306 domain-containing protein [Aquimarina acroporae]
MVHSTIGLIHLIFAIISLITGTYVILTTKGTKLHVIIGYIYVVSMLLMNLTGFGIYHLFGGFGIFHVMIIISLIALFGGMYPVLNRKKVKDWYIQHLRVMSWSIVGLYAAFVSEMSARIIPHPYGIWCLGIGTGLVCFVGSLLIKRKIKKTQNLRYS